jgi:hypothetical protein
MSLLEPVDSVHVTLIWQLTAEILMYMSDYMQHRSVNQLTLPPQQINLLLSWLYVPQLTFYSSADYLLISSLFAP